MLQLFSEVRQQAASGEIMSRVDMGWWGRFNKKRQFKNYQNVNMSKNLNYNVYVVFFGVMTENYKIISLTGSTPKLSLSIWAGTKQRTESKERPSGLVRKDWVGSRWWTLCSQRLKERRKNANKRISTLRSDKRGPHQWLKMLGVYLRIHMDISYVYIHTDLIPTSY